MSDETVYQWIRLSNFLREARGDQGYSQSSLAQRAGVSLRTIQALESGQPRPRIPVVLPRIEKALGLPPGTSRTVLRGDGDGGEVGAGNG